MPKGPVMTELSDTTPLPLPTIMPLGDSSLLVRFGTTLSDAANRAAIAFARLLGHNPVPGVLEIVPNLVSVLLRFDPRNANVAAIAGELRLRLSVLGETPVTPPRAWDIAVDFNGPDLAEVAAVLLMAPDAFIAAHNAQPLRVLATGFAPGFVYCGLHSPTLHLPRRTSVRPMVPAGTVLFAAGQTAITATPLPTGWHVLGHTSFSNFDAASLPPTSLAAGDAITFSVAP
ncbi:MAG: allophanate hydrolase subunit 1 [Alphaproteobacteria bacterium]|nr:allophanate hydrolase subunit 1 [Alphaproteobacteria bacterium]